MESFARQLSNEDGTTRFATCCLGKNCQIADVTNGEFPLAATSRRCVACNGVRHPLCGEIDSQSSLLTCFNCIEAYGQTFESRESAELFVNGLADILVGAGAATTTRPCIGATDAVIQESERERLVKETKRRMMPDECPRLNRSQSTKDNNRNEVVKLIMWLTGHRNESSDQNKTRMKHMIEVSRQQFLADLDQRIPNLAHPVATRNGNASCADDSDV
jgi:hypothetical protein